MSLSEGAAALLDLAKRVEAADWADPALARKVGEATKDFHVRPEWNPLAFLDEAVTLVPNGARRVEFGTYEGGRAWAYVHTSGDVVGESDDAPTEAAAVCAAALKARAASGIDTRQSQDGETRLGPKDESPTPQGDAQRPPQ